MKEQELKFERKNKQQILSEISKLLRGKKFDAEGLIFLNSDNVSVAFNTFSSKTPDRRDVTFTVYPSRKYSGKINFGGTGVTMQKEQGNQEIYKGKLSSDGQVQFFKLKKGNYSVEIEDQ